jgi:hypothetical protein
MSDLVRGFFKSVDLTYLNTFQHCIVKRIQNLRPRTRSDMCQTWRVRIFPYISKFNWSMDDSKSTEIIVRRCMQWSLVRVFFIYSTINDCYFSHKLCSLDDNFLTKRIFMTRLFSYFVDNSRKHFGFVPDIIGILYHYELSDYLVDPDDNSYLMTVFHPRLYVNYISGFSLVGLVRTAICMIYFALKRKYLFFSKLQKHNSIVHFSYYFQFNYTWI